MRILAAGVGLAVMLAGCGQRAQSASAVGTTGPAIAGAVNRVIAAPVQPDPRVGAFFLSDSDLHACTGSVLESLPGDLVLTAAHCLSTSGPARFVPGFARQAAPEEVWTVDARYFDPRWLAGRDPKADYAIARVSRLSGGSVQARAGSGFSLGSSPARGTQVTVIAYPAGIGGLPVGCQVGTGTGVGGYPELPCAGFADGTSGAPWITGATVRGVIGGLHGGGCAENLSYSPPFDRQIVTLFARAQQGGPGDPAPGSFDDQC